MKSDPRGLSQDWITRPAIDAELKRYVLLAYLQRVKAHFDGSRLYPHLDDLADHANALRALQEGWGMLRGTLAREVVGFDPQTGDPVKPPLEHDNDLLQVIEEVIGFALPELHGAERLGLERMEEAINSVRFERVGLLPLDLREGYLLVREHGEAHAYSYAFTVFLGGAERCNYKSVRTSYIGPYTVSIATPYEAIKADLTRTRRELPNPATFLFEADPALPRIETCLPLARRMVWKAITAAA